MLKELRIRNLAIIDDLTVRFTQGLNVLTGETGAGKSIIVDALGLALGARAQSDLIKSGQKEATVQAWFESDELTLPSELGIDTTDGIILRRTVTSGGKSRAYVNDTLVTLQTLSSIGKSLVDIHSQHEHQSLLSAENQQNLLDSYGSLAEERHHVGTLFTAVQGLRSEKAAIMEHHRERAHRTDLLTFQINEINAASLSPGEKEDLEEERTLLANHARLSELSDSVYSLLYASEGSCAEKLSLAIAQVREICSIDGRIEDALKMLESAQPLVEEAAIALREYREGYDHDPGRLDVVEERLEAIRRLERKYGKGVDTILQYRDDAERELKSLESADEKLEMIAQELSSKEEEMLKAAITLSKKRGITARRIEELLGKSLTDLAFGNVAFTIAINQEVGEPGAFRVGPKGMDRIEFLFSSNPGEPVKPLARIISGGELSRVMLALKTILADVDNIPVLIFDEVDAGIGGRTAEMVGKKLKTIAEKRQLLCITHLPQIASLADFHLKIEKNERNDGILVDVRVLEGSERQDEIARMLSGKITDISLRHAGELLEKVE